MTKSQGSLKILPVKSHVLDEAIIDTYFSKKTKRRKTSKSLSKKIKSQINKPLISAAVASLLIFMFATHIVFPRYTNFLKKRFESARVISLFNGKSFNSDVISRHSFNGAAHKTSKIQDKSVIIVNPNKYDWADLSLDFKFPLVTTNKTISFLIRGRSGGEKVSVLARDINNRSAVLAELYLGSGWKNVTLQFDSVANEIDIAQIRHIRFECGFTGDPPGKTGTPPAETLIYIKDMKISKKETSR